MMQNRIQDSHGKGYVHPAVTIQDTRYAAIGNEPGNYDDESSAGIARTYEDGISEKAEEMKSKLCFITGREAIRLEANEDPLEEIGFFLKAQRLKAEVIEICRQVIIGRRNIKSDSVNGVMDDFEAAMDDLKDALKFYGDVIEDFRDAMDKAGRQLTHNLKKEADKEAKGVYNDKKGADMTKRKNRKALSEELRRLRVKNEKKAKAADGVSGKFWDRLGMLKDFFKISDSDEGSNPD
ncbi:hypothetical protein F5X99DRAFT_378843, partial [Biscogniauxia marginata]